MIEASSPMSTVRAVQDQVMATRVIEAKVMHKSIPTLMCRVCGQAEETIIHLLAACPILLPIFIVTIWWLQFYTGIYLKCILFYLPVNHGLLTILNQLWNHPVPKSCGILAWQLSINMLLTIQIFCYSIISKMWNIPG